MTFGPGIRLGSFEILSLIGAGGMGEVYKARDTRLDRTVAIKILPSADPQLKTRFEREGKAVAQLQHPHICTLFDVGHHEGTDYLILEYLEGETLAHRLEHGPLRLQESLTIAIEIADALHTAHRHGIVHRDLKPSNVMLTKAGAKLMDFGLARLSSAAIHVTASIPTMSQRPLTTAGSIMGTFPYMSPEQVQGEEVDARSDIFSFGTVLYEMATGRRAFEGKTPASIVAAILEREPRPITAIQPMTPPALDRLVRSCLAKEPDERIQAAYDVKLHLRWLTEESTDAGIVTPLVINRKRWQRAWIAATFLLGALVVGFGVAYFSALSKIPPVVRSSILPPKESRGFLTFASRAPGYVALSPDGRFLAFSAISARGIAEIFVRALDSVDAHALAGTEWGCCPFWSPDSSSIGFWQDGRVKRTHASGGPAQVVAEATGRFHGGSWNADGTILFASGSDRVYRVPAMGGTATPATKRSAGEGFHGFPHFLPDGRHFLYVTDQGSQRGDVLLASLDGVDAPRRLFSSSFSQAIYAYPGYILFVRDGSLMAQPFEQARLRLLGEAVPLADDVVWDKDGGWFGAVVAASQTGLLVYQTGMSTRNVKLQWFDVKGNALNAVGEPGEYRSPRISPDGKRVAVTIEDASSGIGDIWIIDLERGVKSKLTFGVADHVVPVWSPDGRQLAFGEEVNGKRQLFVKASNGIGGEQRLLKSDAADYPLDWSRDGRYLSFLRSVPGKPKELWVLPMSGNHKPFPFMRSGYVQFEGTFSPNGRWLAYTSGETNRGEIYVAPFPGGEGKWQVSRDGGIEARWSKDGKQLFFVWLDKMMATEVNETVDGLRVGQVRELFRLQTINSEGWPYDLSGDGKKLLVATRGLTNSAEPLTLVTNWASQLKR